MGGAGQPQRGSEAAWMRKVGGWLPQAAPKILGEDAEAGLFAMEYLPPDENPVWKTELLAGRVDVSFAGEVGKNLATIHARSAADPEIPPPLPMTTRSKPLH